MNFREMKVPFESTTVLSFFDLLIVCAHRRSPSQSGSPTNSIDWYLGCLRAVANFTAKILHVGWAGS